MIKYSLICDKGHVFESWFADAASFDVQVKRGFVECPQCQSIHVTKALMAPAVATSRRRRSAMREVAHAMAAQRMTAQASVESGASSDPAAPAAALGPAAIASPVALMDERQREMRGMIRELHQKLTENSTDVGENFSKEARAIHDGDAPQRPIHGRASFAEAKALAEEGIPVLPLPILPDERN